MGRRAPGLPLPPPAGPGRRADRNGGWWTGRRLRRPFLLCLLSFAIGTVDASGPENSWADFHGQLEQRSQRLRDHAANLNGKLVGALRECDEAAAQRLAAPSARRATGYGLLPEIRRSTGYAPVNPVRTRYDMSWLETQLAEAERRARRLDRRCIDEADAEDLVSSFDALRATLDLIDDHLAYHAQWQRSVRRHRAYFEERNRLLPEAERLRELLDQGADASVTEPLRERLLAQLSPFRPVAHLSLEHRGDASWSLPLRVCTDIHDGAFLAVAKSAVERLFQGEIQGLGTLRVELSWHQFQVSELYAGDSPESGRPIDEPSHRLRFRDCPLVLTTGAADTHARTGDRVVLGTRPVTERTLAHEFGHLLGFEDAYLRGYEGSLKDPAGVAIIEWAGLAGDLMGNSEHGDVSERMLRQLFHAYGPQP